MNTITITQKRKSIVDFIRQFKKARGYMPTVRDIGRALKQKHPSVVQYHLNKLQEAGVIEKGGSARSIELGEKVEFNVIENGYQRGETAGRRVTRIPISKEIQMLEYFGGCAYCGKVYSGTYHKEHFVPYCLGGVDDKSNILLSCPSCNLNKGAKEPAKWVVENFGIERLEKILIYLHTR